MNDYIDRDTISKQIREWRCKNCDNHKDLYCRACDVKNILDMIENAPAANVEPIVYGEWVYGKYDIPHYSECGNVVMLDKISNYCPNCGAKMKGKRISDDDD